MRAFAIVTGLGALAFLALAIPATRGDGPVGGEAAAQEAVREFLVLARHFQASGGDPRFAERIPASARIVREALDETAFAREALGLVELPELVRTDVLGSTSRPDGVVEVRTREYWVFQRQGRSREKERMEPIAAVVRATYEVGREAGRWVVLDYRVDPGPREVD